MDDDRTISFVRGGGRGREKRGNRWKKYETVARKTNDWKTVRLTDVNVTGSDFVMGACLHFNWSRVGGDTGGPRVEDGSTMLEIINGGNVFLCFRCDGASWSRLLL